jgi:hypothetical protein
LPILEFYMYTCLYVPISGNEDYFIQLSSLDEDMLLYKKDSNIFFFLNVGSSYLYLSDLIK